MVTIKNSDILAALVFALLAAVVHPLLLYIVAGLTILYSYYEHSQKFILPFAILSYLILVSDIDERIRLTINIFNFLALGYLFFREYGIEIKIYKKLPRELIAFFSMIFLSMLLSTVFSESMLTGFKEIGRTLLFTLIIYWFYSFIKDIKNIFIYLNAIMAAGIIISIYIMVEFINSDKLQYLLLSSGFVTVGGFFTNSTAVGGFLAITISLSMAYLFLNQLTEVKKYFIWTFIVLQLFSLLLTNARAAILAAAISNIFIIFKLRKKLFRKIILFSAIIFSILFFIPQFNLIFDSFFRTNRVLENTRYYLWEMAWGMIRSHPVFGVGPGMFRNYMYTYLPVPLGSWTEQQIYVLQKIAAAPAHNFFLLQASELGLAGLFVSIYLFFIFFKFCAAAMRLTYLQSKQEYILSVAITGIGLGLFARSFFESTGIFTNGWIARDLPFWILFAIIIFMNEKNKNKIVKSGKLSK